MEEPDAQQIQPRFSEEDELDPVEDRIEALVSYTDLQLAALLPNPEGSDLEGEEIHVRNRSNHSIDLSGVTLSDMTTTYRFPEGEQILPAQTLILPRSLTRISLNNSGSETIRLSDPNDVLLDEVTYTNSFEGEYYARTPAGWLWDHDSVDTPSDVVETEIPQYAQPTPKAFVLPTEKPAVTTTQEEQKVEPLADSSIAFATSGRLARLSEVFPAPLHTLEDEWVELLNPTEETIDISGYQLDDITDGGSKSYIFPEGSRIEAKTYFTIPKSESGIALNNTADTVHFLAPAGDVLDSFSYESTTKGMSFSRIDDDWQLTSPTPDEENTPSQDNAQTSSVTSATTSPHAQTDEQNSDADVSPTDSTRERTSIRTARSLPEGTPVRVSGIVTATAGELISNGFVVQDETSGIQVIFPRDSVPEISAGANVEVVGTIDTYRSATIVRAESPSRVTVLGEDAIPTPLDRELGELGLEDVGFRIITSGFLLSKQGQTMLLEDQGTELRVTFRERTGISKPSWETGSRITLSGILLQTSDGWRLYPSVPEDVEQQNDQPEALALGVTDETTST
ncbi:MAG: lamin tail domain-containing protein, partial [Candidatus Andersenbacteria bacterium]|nr:lamin tail domain-containing protein [Candidatus Andersenbacteria bacterium]